MLIMALRKGGELRYVNVIDGIVSGSYWAGGIAGRNDGLIEYCSFSGDVHGSQDFVGGIVGDNHTGGILRYCCTARKSNGTDSSIRGKQIAGGVAGPSTRAATQPRPWARATATTRCLKTHSSFIRSPRAVHPGTVGRVQRDAGA